MCVFLSMSGCVDVSVFVCVCEVNVCLFYYVWVCQSVCVCSMFLIYLGVSVCVCSGIYFYYNMEVYGLGISINISRLPLADFPLIHLSATGGFFFSHNFSTPSSAAA